MRDYRKVLLRHTIMLMVFLFGIIFAVATTVAWKMDLNVYYAILISIGMAFLQFLISPWIIDLVYKTKFNIEKEYIDKEVLEFINKVSRDANKSVPKIGIIKDGNPNAFTYGHFSKDARLVVTTGLLDILDISEQKAVIGHELGHIKYNDFITMTLVSLIPMIAYDIYIFTKCKKNKNTFQWAVGIGAYVAYILSGFLVLCFSRIREYYADKYSKSLLNSGEFLKSALIKISYGTKSREKDNTPSASCMGFVNNVQNDAIMLSTYKLENKLDKKLMSWDLSNVWAKWYEVNSTHPLTAKRILALDSSQHIEKKSVFKNIFMFIGEVIVKLLPWIYSIGFIGYKYLNGKLDEGIKDSVTGFFKEPNYELSIFIALLGVTILIRYYYSYSNGFKENKIYNLLGREDASPVKGIPCTLKGKIIGKGIPGLFYSEDLVIDDRTGIILVDYRQPLSIFEFMFGILKVDEIQEKEVEIVGWYKRGMKPYFVSKYIVVDGKKIRSFNFVLQQIFGYGFLMLAAIIYLF